MCPLLVPNNDLTRNDTTITNGDNSFFNNVNDWKSTYNTPHHLMHNKTVSPYCTQNWGTGNWGTVTNCISANTDNSNNEGFHTTNFNFINNQFISYCISADYKRLSCSSSPPSLSSNLVFRSAANLPVASTSPLSPTHGTNFFILKNETVVDYDPHRVDIEYSPYLEEPNSMLNYNQFQVFQCNAVSLSNPPVYGNSAISFDSINIICKTAALTGFTSTTGMPTNCGLTHNFVPILNHNGCEKSESYAWYVKGSGTPDAPFATTENAMFTFPTTGIYEVSEIH
jgi:hypothetical protein